MSHLFIFQPGTWIGEGKVMFTASPDTIRFFTRWSTQEISPTEVTCLQEVELHGVQETNRNQFTLSELHPTHFKITLLNDLMGRISGKGVIGPKTIAWELRDHPGYEGFEIYELQDNGEYHFRAEYASGDQYRTLIEGKIWRKEE